MTGSVVVKNAGVKKASTKAQAAPKAAKKAKAKAQAIPGPLEEGLAETTVSVFGTSSGLMTS